MLPTISLDASWRRSSAPTAGGGAGSRTWAWSPVGDLPPSLFSFPSDPDLARLPAVAASLGVRENVAQGRSVRFAPVDPPESGRMRLTRLYPGTVLKPATRTIVVPAPGSARMGGGAVEGEELLRWAEVLLRAVVVGDKDYEAEATRYRRRR